MYDLQPLKNKISEAQEWLKGELASIHTGRAVPALLDSVTVSAYGTHSPVSHIATVTAEDPKTLRISPWDKSQIKDIERAINDADLGVSVVADTDGLRVCFPELTTERRQMFVKLAREKLEDARISIRGEREKVWSDIQEKERSGEISEDDKFRLKDELQKIIDDANKTLEEMANKKETEIMG